MRPNDKILLENIDDYHTYKCLPSNIDDIEEKWSHDLAKSEAKTRIILSIEEVAGTNYLDHSTQYFGL